MSKYEFGHWLHWYNKTHGTSYNPRTVPGRVKEIYRKGMEADPTFWWAIPEPGV